MIIHIHESYSYPFSTHYNSNQITINISLYNYISISMPYHSLYLLSIPHFSNTFRNYIPMILSIAYQYPFV